MSNHLYIVFCPRCSGTIRMQLVGGYICNSCGTTYSEIEMSRTPERKVKDDVKCELTNAGAFFTMPVPSGYGESMLDFVGHHKGEYFEIETKAPGKHPTPRQEHRIERIRESGGKVFVIGEELYGDDNFQKHEYSGMAELKAWLKR